ncbi:MAG: DUF4359 domain-containing protein [Oscillatoriales cyanobacterium C42_A2020_001]|nr:DUF4359 domain-containing protein [Leptolyngbyaceae cyanobacterium C42_A2020_001]
MMDSSWAEQHGVGITPRNMVIGLGIASITSLGIVMAVTNPSQAAYETYATQKIVTLLDRNVCAEAPTAFGLRNDCKNLLKTNRSKIREFVADSTERRDFLFFSVYTTRLSVASFLPTYRVETIGAFHQFQIYETIQEN